MLEQITAWPQDWVDTLKEYKTVSTSESMAPNSQQRLYNLALHHHRRQKDAVSSEGEHVSVSGSGEGGSEQADGGSVGAGVAKEAQGEQGVVIEEVGSLVEADREGVEEDVEGKEDGGAEALQAEE